jgi:hypothetical protein
MFMGSWSDPHRRKASGVAEIASEIKRHGGPHGFPIANAVAPFRFVHGSESLFAAANGTSLACFLSGQADESASSVTKAG